MGLLYSMIKKCAENSNGGKIELSQGRNENDTIQLPKQIGDTSL